VYTTSETRRTQTKPLTEQNRKKRTRQQRHPIANDRIRYWRRLPPRCYGDGSGQWTADKTSLKNFPKIDAFNLKLITGEGH